MGKIWLTKHKEMCLNILAFVAICAASFVLGWYAEGVYEERTTYAALWEAIKDLPDPEQCALCGEGMRYHAPCLVNLSTGQVGEMTVYTDHPSQRGEIAPMEKQQTGTLSFRPCAGLTAVQDTCAHTCKVTLPEQKRLMNPALFCRECRLLLAMGGLEGYVIVDLYDLDDIRAYPIQYDVIRDYRISVKEQKTDILEVCVTGLL